MKPRSEQTAREVEHVRDRLRRALEKTPVGTLPAVAARVVALVGDPESSIRDLSDVVKSDTGLTGRVLRLVNSAYYGLRKPVGDVQRAAVVLGMERMKALALGFHVSRAYEGCADDEAVRRVWTHSLYRAWVGLHLGESVRRDVAGEAFVAGLLSDAGEPLLAGLLADGLPEDIAAEANGRKRFAMERSRLPFTHVDVGVVLGGMWGLPKELLSAIEHHHDAVGSVDAGDGSSVLRGVASFVSMVPLGDEGAGASGAGTAAVVRRARGAFGLGDDAMERLLSAAAADYRGAVDVFEPLVDPTLSIDALVRGAHECLSRWSTESMGHSLQDEAAAGSGGRLSAGGFVFDLERIDQGGVRVYIADRGGNRVLSEQVHPWEQSVDEIRGTLLLSGASDEEFDAVMESIRVLAA